MFQEDLLFHNEYEYNHKRYNFNPLQEHNTNQPIYDQDFEQDQLPQKKPLPQNLSSFLAELDENHNSEDQGIQDYKIGGYHPVHIGEVLIKRYVVIQKLGWGHFSTVWLCKDFKYDTYVAIKIQKSSPHYMEAAFDQVEILQKVERHHRDEKWEGITRDDTHIVSLLNSFIHKSHYGNHFCMVFQILRCNLLDILKRYNYEGVPMDIAQEISRQVLIGLDYLHRICGVIHTDLKPQNVMVCLSTQQIRDIVENGQLTKNQLFAQRTEIFQKFLGIAPTQKKKEKQKKSMQQVKISYQGMTKNQIRNLKKKLRKKKKKQKQNMVQNQNELSEQQQVVPKSIEQLFDLKKGKIVFNRGDKLKLPFTVKIADLGNACWKHHHFSSQIQTRQYRSPQVILGQAYNETADIWSFACMMYQMLTGDLLFQPKKGNSWSKNDDHLAQIQQLIGKFNKNFCARGKKSKKYFTKDGLLKRVPQLQFWPLDIVLKLKHRIDDVQAKEFAEFLLPMLIPEPELRISASKALDHPWLKRKIIDYKMSQQEYQSLKTAFNNNQQILSKLKSNIVQDQQYASQEDNAEVNQYYVGKEQVKEVEIKLVDRSFTDLGYIGYCDGIALQQLDSCPNWQFL